MDYIYTKSLISGFFFFIFFSKKVLTVIIFSNRIWGTDGTDGTEGTAVKLRKGILNMEINSSGDVYQQIVNYYRKYISLGVLEVNYKMPSCRELAISIGVNHKTVEKAYSELVKEGLIYNVPKKGFYVKGKQEKDNKMVREVLLKLKLQGVSKEELEQEIALVYKED